MPTTARIINLVAGTFAVIGGIILAAGLSHLWSALQPLFTIGIPAHLFPFLIASHHWLAGLLAPLFGSVYAVVGLLIVLGTAATVSSIYALWRGIWGVALAASICAFFCVWWLGIPAIVFTVMAKDEFK
jgi:hypothetical protein